MENNIIECMCSQSIDWTNIIMAIASIFNILVVIYVFISEKKDNNRKREKENKDSWYNMFEIKNKTVALSNNIDSLKNITNNFYSGNINQEEFFSEYKKVENELIKFKSEFITIVDCLDPEKDEVISVKFREIQDKLYDLITKYVGDKNADQKISSHEVNVNMDDIKKSIIQLSVNLI